MIASSIHMQTPDCEHVIFDMDGTLTRSGLDFDLIRNEIGITGGPVWEGIQTLPEAQRAAAIEIVHRHEAADAAKCLLQPYAVEVVRALRAKRIPVSLMTRNSKISVDVFLERHDFEFDLIRTRDDGVVKPSPIPVLELCEQAGVLPTRTWVIGDFHFDVICANAAGAVSVLFLEPEMDQPEWAGEARFVVRDLRKFGALVGISVAA